MPSLLAILAPADIPPGDPLGETWAVPAVAAFLVLAAVVVVIAAVLIRRGRR